MFKNIIQNYNFTFTFKRENRKNCTFSMIELRFLKLKDEKRFQIFFESFWKKDKVHFEG